jgi:hypothetical protein
LKADDEREDAKARREKRLLQEKISVELKLDFRETHQTQGFREERPLQVEVSLRNVLPH